MGAGAIPVRRENEKQKKGGRKMRKSIVILAMVLMLVSSSLAAEFGLVLVYATDVQITMSVSVEADVARYNIYRSATPGAYDITKLVGTTTEPVFIDKDVPDGVWYWVATFQDTAGNESMWSNEVSATLDATPPEPPTILELNIL